MLVSLVLAVMLWGTTGGADARTLGTWCETVTADFHLVSDLEQDAQSELLALLARLKPVAEPFLPGDAVSTPTALKIIVFKRQNDFRALTGKRKFAAFMQPSLQTNRLLVGPIRGSLTETTLHEYAHYLLRNRQDVSLPLWFDEGLASLLGEADFDDSSVTLGRLPVQRLKARANEWIAGQTPLEALTATLETTGVEDWSPSRINAFYDWSWLLVHYLTFERLHGASIAGTDLEQHLAERSVSLIEHLDTTPRSLLRDLERYLRNPADPRTQPSPPPATTPGSYRCLSDFERDHELAKAVLEQNPEGARALIEPHVRERPRDVALLVTRARIALALDDDSAAASLADRALALEPENVDAIILAAEVTVWGCLFDQSPDCRDRWERARSLYRQGLRLDPGRFDGILGLGLAYLYTGRPGEAVNYIRVAYSRAPWAALVNYYLGESYRLIGDTRARRYLQNARNWAVLDVWRVLAQASLEMLDASSDLR